MPFVELAIGSLSNLAALRRAQLSQATTAKAH
jgi:hypothetical protein